MNVIRIWTLAALLILALSAVGLHIWRSEAKARISDEIHLIQKLNWVCYAPTQYDPKRGLYPTTASITSDLETLRSAGFEGIITYECAGPLEQIADLARRQGLSVIQGIWGPADKVELQNAVRLKDQVVAYCVGNEGLGTRYTIRELDQGLTYLSNRTGVPTTVSEQVHLYFEHPDLIDMGDWLFPIVHPHFGSEKSVEGAVHWLDANLNRLASAAADRGWRKDLFPKEVGMPSGGDDEYSEATQARFIELMLERSGPPFALFEAFDRRGWEYITAVEPYWGLFRSDRSPKQAALGVRRILANREVQVAR